MHTELDRLATEKYLLLTTFRKDGRGVSTPVWAAQYGEELVVRTLAHAGKVKRIRRNGTVQVAPCDIRGRARGQSVPGHARLLDPDQMRGAQAAIERKYGIISRLVSLTTRLRQGPDSVVGIAIALQETDRSPGARPETG
ncbi:MAG: PPOX class F420-dependent oxidoreductase [Pseudonocardiales bacterium]|nr:PPOX class F420-dependent oxidoreductase [Pseudonocardiales bacterium]